MRRFVAFLTFAAVLSVSVFLSSCDEGEPRFSTTYPCQFIFHGNYHPGSALLRTMDNPGLFAIVSSHESQGRTILTVSLNDGATEETIPLNTEIENKHNYKAMGANRSLIIGCSAFDGLKAYDRQCRYCLDNSSSTNFPLSWADKGRAVECAKCKRVYVLNTGASNDGQRLLEYAVRFDGQILTVNNK